MNTPFDFGTTHERLVYIRSIKTADLPEHIREQTGDLDTVYGVFGANGEQIALTKDRSMAFMLARDNEMDPVSVH